MEKTSAPPPKISQPQTVKKIARNVFYGFLTWILPLGLSFVAAPVIVRKLGERDYGIYALVLGFVAYSFSFSIGRAITKYIAEFRSTGESEKIRDVISATLFLNISVGLLGVFLICGLADWLVRDVFLIEAAARDQTVLAFYAAAFVIFFSALNQVFSAVLQGIHRFDVFSNVTNFNSFALLAGNLILVYAGFGLLSLLVWNLFLSALVCLIFVFYAKKFLPEFGVTFRFKPEILTSVLKYSSGIIGYQILANALLLFERGWITRRLGAENLTYYVVPMLVGLNIHAFVSSIVIVVFPLASELKNEPEKLLRLYLKSTKIVGFLVVFLVTTVIVERREFLSLWMKGSFAERSSDVLLLHTITFGLAALLSVSWQMTEGLGFPNYNFAVYTICIVISVPLMILLTNEYGNFGIAAARLAGFGALFFSIFAVEKWFFRKIQIKFWLETFGALAASMFTAALLEIWLIQRLPPVWSTLFLVTFCGGVVYLAALWLLGFVKTDEKILIKSILNG